MRLSLLVIAATCLAASGRVLRGKYVSVEVGSDVCNVTAFGAKGDGVHNDTAAIQAAFDSCGGAGGQVLLPAGGTYLAAALHFTGNNTDFHIPLGATLLVSDDIQQWPNGSHVLSARGLSHVAITGGGTVQGQGERWWRAMEQPGQKDIFRPHLVDMSHVTFALLQGVRFVDGPNHVLELGADHAELDGIAVLAPPSTGDVPVHSHNTDAVDVHGSPFFIHHVNFTTGDDNVAVHANDTLVEDSYFGTGHGASIGSLCGSYLTNITFRRITFQGTTAGARIKSHPNCSGHVWNVTYEDLVMRDVLQTIQVNQYYFGTGPSSYLFENITFRNITAVGAGAGDSGIGSDGGPTHVVNFDCDTGFDGKANCHNFLLDEVQHVDPQGDMYCHGAWGQTRNSSGLDSCLAPVPTL